MKKKISIFLIIITAFFTGGCSEIVEVGSNAFVHGAEIKIDSETGKYHMIIEVCNPKKAINKDNVFTEVLEVKADSIFACVRDTIKTYGRKLYWAHTKSLLISEEIVKENCKDVIDFFLRDTETRGIMNLIVTKHSDENAFVLDTRDNVVIAHNLNDMLINSQFNPKFMSTDVFNFMKDLETEGIDPCATFLKVNYMKDKYFPRLYGTAVFDKDGLVGELDEEETKMIYILKNLKNKGLYYLENTEDEKRFEYTLEFIKCSTKIKPEYDYDTGELRFNIGIKSDALIMEHGAGGDIFTVEEIERIERVYSAELKREILATIDKLVNDLKGDIIGFGRILNSKYPDAWEELKDDWYYNLSKAEFHVETNMKITGTGLMK